MGRNYICGLDIGTYKICLTCGQVEPSGKINILASQTHPAQGLSAGKIINGKKLSSSIRDACVRLRKRSGLKVRRVYANIDSLDLKARVSEQQLAFGQNNKIGQREIKKAINCTISSNITLDRRPLYACFSNFSNADKAKLKIATVSAFIPTIDNYTKCIWDAGLTLEGLVPSGYAQALGLAGDSKSHREVDNILIDFGAGLTKITFFEGMLLKDIVTLPLGAQNITEDIATALKVSFDCAEKLKIKYGRIFCENRLPSQKIIVQDKLTRKIISLGPLYEIISSKVDSFLQEVKKSLSGLNYSTESPVEIIVAGGGAMLEGFLERVEKILQTPVKMGFLSVTNNSRMQAQSALYATSIGLILLGHKRQDGLRRFHSRRKFSYFVDMANRAKNLYREYF